MATMSIADPPTSVRSVTPTVTAKPALDILLVDDAVELRADMAHYFARQGHHVQQCGDGDRALDLIDRHVFDVVVLDLIMPGRSGLDVLKELKIRQAECDVVVLTGEATIESAVEAMKLGAARVPQKADQPQRAQSTRLQSV